jgi:hypothetical protein
MTFAERIGRLHLYYLALLPAVGSVFLVYVLHVSVNPIPFFLFGTAGIGISIASTASYAPISDHATKNVFALLDGPLWIVIASIVFHESLVRIVLNGVFVEMLAAFFGVLAVIVTSRVPTSAQRRNAAIAVGIPLFGTILLFLLYRAEQSFSFSQTIVLGAAVLQGALTHFRLGSTMTLRRSPESFILVGIFAWLAAFFVIGPMVATI